MGREFDYVIVGGGSAGCVLANRLSTDPSVSVLLEAGGAGRNLFIDMPSAFAIPMASKEFNWGYYSAPEPISTIANRLCAGRGLGGSSAINGMAMSAVMPGILMSGSHSAQTAGAIDTACRTFSELRPDARWR